MCRPKLTAWVAFAATDDFLPDDGSMERVGVGGGVETFSGSTVICTSRSVLAKMFLPVLGSMTSRGVVWKEDKVEGKAAASSHPRFETGFGKRNIHGELVIGCGKHSSRTPLRTAVAPPVKLWL